MTLSELAGNGWVLVDPPKDTDGQNVVARYRGEPLNAGFRLEEEERDGEIYSKFRSGQYDLEIIVDFEVARGRARVTEAEGYEDQ